MAVIDADAHVIESEATWDFIPASDQRYRPTFLRKGERGSARAGWLIDDKLLLHSDFYPIYEEAQRLDLAIAVHLANGNTAMCDMLSANPYPGSGFWKFRLPTIGAFQSLAMSQVPDLFPKLRFGFLEAAAQWVPYVLFDLRRRPEAPAGRHAATVLRDIRFYVTCQTDDDLPYLMQQAGEGWILLGTDYGHSDPSTELNAFRVL